MGATVGPGPDALAGEVVGEPVAGERVAFGCVVVAGVLAVGPGLYRGGGWFGRAQERFLVLQDEAARNGLREGIGLEAGPRALPPGRGS
jgi:hypothetical protein